MQLLTYTWDFEKALDLGIVGLRYYSLLFALGFILGYLLMKRIFQKEGISLEWLDSLLVYAVVGTVIGARLGHVFFYSWDYYQNNLIEIFMVWEGGLASHGAAIALIIAMYLFSKKVTKKSMFWILDKFVITVALAGCFIRLGNMANSEIYGKVANSSIETVYLNPPKTKIQKWYSDYIADVSFKKTNNRLETDTISYPIYNMKLVAADGVSIDELKTILGHSMMGAINRLNADDQNILFQANSDIQVDELARQPTLVIQVLGVPRYPTQIIEAVAYLLIFVILYLLYQQPRLRSATGFTFGAFLVLVFGFRFLVEYMKANQIDRETEMALNMGQWLSIPLVIGGIAMCVWSLQNKKFHE
jgi:phosphatidylglycerol:prolipoprotein diacylglycerol transferase